MQIQTNREFTTGLIFIAIGLFFLYFGQQYNLGSPFKMGPGFLPFYLASALTCIGLIQVLRSFKARKSYVSVDIVRPIIIMASIAGFAYVLPWTGAIIGIGLVMLISGILHPNFVFKFWLISYLVVIALALMFKFLLGSSIPLWTF